MGQTEIDKSDLKSPDSHIKDYQKQLRRLASELSLTEARERREIASDLHDHIGQALAYVSQKLSILKGNTIFSGMESDFIEIDKILKQTIQYTRDLTVEISPPILYEFGLPAAVEWLIERADKRYNLKISLSQKGSIKIITDDVKVFIFKAIKELIHNVSKHANATKVSITINWNKDDFAVMIKDNGQGFDTTNLEKKIIEDCCFGLFSIRERLSYIGGDMVIKASPKTGTEVIIKAPYIIHKETEND